MLWQEFYWWISLHPELQFSLASAFHLICNWSLFRMKTCSLLQMRFMQCCCKNFIGENPDISPSRNKVPSYSWFPSDLYSINLCMYWDVFDDYLYVYNAFANCFIRLTINIQKCQNKRAIGAPRRVHTTLHMFHEIRISLKLFHWTSAGQCGASALLKTILLVCIM